MEHTARTILDGNQTEYAFSEIKSKILSGECFAGERLKIRDYAEILGVSPGAVREALSRLVADGLVISRSQKGFVVTPLRPDDLQDLTELRCEIEEIALRRSVERGGLDWEGEIVAAAHRMQGSQQFEAGSDRVPQQEWLRYHFAFHSALVSACGIRRLIELHRDLFEQSVRYQQVAVYVGRQRNGTIEHQALVRAALARDADRLVEIAVSHIRTTTDLILQAMRVGRIATI